MQANGNVLQFKKGRSVLTSERGSSIVEAALLVLVLVPLVLGAINFGRAFYVSIEIANAARVAAQFGSQNTVDQQNTAAVASVAKNEAPDISASCGAGKTCWVSGYPLAQWGCECSNQSTPGGGTMNSNSCSGSCATGHFVSFVLVTTKATYTPLFSFGGRLFPAMTMTCQAKMRFALS